MSPLCQGLFGAGLNCRTPKLVKSEKIDLQWHTRWNIYICPVNKGKMGSRESKGGRERVQGRHTFTILSTPSMTHKHLQSNPLGVQRAGKVGCRSRKSVHGEEKVVEREHYEITKNYSRSQGNTDTS